jgi:hypothetical protein
MRSFTTDIRGHTYRAAWKLEGSEVVEVRSDYGNECAALDGREPGEVAREVLTRIVQHGMSGGRQPKRW